VLPLEENGDRDVTGQPSGRRGPLLRPPRMCLGGELDAHEVGLRSLTSDVGRRGGDASAGSCRGDQVAVSTLTFPWASLTHDHLTGEEDTDDARSGWV